MVNIRIIEISKMKAAYSGPLTSEEVFEKFNNWFSDFHNSLNCELFPRDFMWYNERTNVREWFYALPQGYDESKLDNFQVVDLPSGLYACASCLDADIDGAKDWLNTRQEIIDYINKSDMFKLHENKEGSEERYPMFQIISPLSLISEGISIENLYVPIEKK